MSFSDLDVTDKEFQNLKAHWDVVWSQKRADDRLIDELVLNTYRIWKDDDDNLKRTQHRSPRASNILTHAVAAQSATEPRVHREPINGTPDAKKHADELEKALALALILTARKNTVLTWKQLFRYLFQYDYGIITVGTETRDWAREEPKEESFSDSGLFELRHQQWEREQLHYNPLILDAPHPSRVLLDPMEKNPHFAIESRTMQAFQVADLVIDKKRIGRAKMGKDFPHTDKPFDPVTIDELWTEKKHKIYHGGELLWEEENFYAAVLYFQAFGGHGWEGVGPNSSSLTGGTSPGTSLVHTEGMRPEQLGRPMLLPVRDLLRLETQQLNARNENIMRSSYRPIVTSKDAESLLEQLRNGVIGGVKPGEISFMPYPDISPLVMQEEVVIDRDIQDATISSLTSGQRPVGVDTVGQTAVLHQLSDNTFNDVRAQVEDVASLVCSAFMRLVEVEAFGDRLPKDGLRFGKHFIKPSHIKGDYNAEVSFEIVDPVIHLQEKQFALQEYLQGASSLERYLTVARVEDVSGEKDKILEDEVDKEPETREALKADIRAKKGVLELNARVQEDRERTNGDLPDVAPDFMDGNGLGIQPPGSPGEAAQASRQIDDSLRDPLGGVEPQAAKPAPRRR